MVKIDIEVLKSKLTIDFPIELSAYNIGISDSITNKENFLSLIFNIP